MCVAIPARLVRIAQSHSVLGRRGVAMDQMGVEREVILAMVPDAEVGDYVVIHSGYAVRQVNAIEAEETRALFWES